MPLQERDRLDLLKLKVSIEKFVEDTRAPTYLRSTPREEVGETFQNQGQEIRTFLDQRVGVPALNRVKKSLQALANFMVQHGTVYINGELSAKRMSAAMEKMRQKFVPQVMEQIAYLAPDENQELGYQPEEAAKNKYNKYRTKLPRRIASGEFDVITLPVVPIFEDFRAQEPKMLSKFGFKFDILNGMPVLHDQFILVVDRSNVTVDVGKTKSMDKQRVILQDVVADYANGMLDFMGRKFGKEYTLMSQDFRLGANKNLALFWFVPASLKNMISKYRNAKVKTWDFPWEAGHG